MADTFTGLTDEENPHGGSRVLPFSTTSRFEAAGKREEASKGPANCRQLLYERLGLEELVSLSVWRASLAEVLGTAVLVFLIDTIVISSFQTDTKTPNVLISFLIFLSITILLLATAPMSGGHINPIVTFSAALLGLISPTRASVYIMAQCCGGVLGALGLKAVVGHTIEQAFLVGGCTLRVVAQGPEGAVSVGVETSQGLWLEIICTFIFLYGSIWIAFDKRQARAHGPVIVCSIVGAVLGLLVFISLTVTNQKGYSGAGINPARCIGPALVRGGHLWDDHWVYWVGPAIGCAIFYLYIKISPPEHFHADYDFKYDFITTVKTILCSRTPHRSSI
ncbi:aquaporin PIP1-2-like [Aristolochia californica]|uniref:aquaporin PIP1-2-like n=1 Tax=Aristolochia californica TaxID=171875 RepID=UPI0035D840FA